MFKITLQIRKRRSKAVCFGEYYAPIHLLHVGRSKQVRLVCADTQQRMAGAERRILQCQGPQDTGRYSRSHLPHLPFQKINV